MNMALWNDEQHRPLQHIRVIDTSVMLPGPLLTRILAQHGADVIKVEKLPGGDPIRDFDDSNLHELLNHGKRSLALDLQKEEGKAVLKQLVEEADLFVESYREGIMDQLGLGYADLSEINPDLLYFSLRGFAGKEAGHAGHDINFIAASGCGEWFIESGNPNYSTQFGDLVGGVMVPAIKLLVHLANPARRGMHVVSNMDENFRMLYLPRAFDEFKSGGNGGEYHTLQEHLDGSRPHSRFYRCRDNRWVSLNAVQDKHWKAFCEMVDHEEWIPRKDDPKLVPDLVQLFEDAPSSYWDALATKKEACLRKVTTWEEQLNYSQTKPQLSADPLSWCGFLPNLSLTKAPALGQDTFTLLHSLGATNKEISALADAGVILKPNNPTS
ncbi:MAG: CoA transferase [Bdellovibrionaceae bacterium]|nr:CoA transferase [Bdellovibrionales bacterium]MCB9253786.1 CoA transferase [Pseudobdellovibrionaceae bacterium]